jgi:hypothetical protein
MCPGYFPGRTCPGRSDVGDDGQRCDRTYGFARPAQAAPYITIGVLLLIGAVLTVSPVVYQSVEKVKFFFVGLIVLFMIYALVALVIGGDGYADVPRLRRGRPDPWRDLIDRGGHPAGRHRVRRLRQVAQPGPVQLGARQLAGHYSRT